MYIINPFRKKGMRASNLTSTHPPISERIRILRSMAGGASFANYDQSYRQVHKADKGVIATSALTTVEPVPLRAATPEAGEGEPDQIQRARDTSAVLWQLSNYKTINCACGTKLRVPPKFKQSRIKCPHCGRINPI